MDFISCSGGTVSESDSIAIIGGADGPTAIFVAGDIDALVLSGLIIVGAVILVVALLRRMKR